MCSGCGFTGRFDCGFRDVIAAAERAKHFEGVELSINAIATGLRNGG
jgi:hypothetical protein